MKIKFDSGDNYSLTKVSAIYDEAMRVIRCVFNDKHKYYTQVFLDEYLCKLIKQITI